MEASFASPGELDRYTNGLCHAFAVALHRHAGMGIVIVSDVDASYADPAEGRRMPGILHVYALDEDGMAWDVAGTRSLADVEAEVRLAHPGPSRILVHEPCNEAGLSRFVQRMDLGFGRPLQPLFVSDIVTAWDVACSALPGLVPSPAP